MQGYLCWMSFTNSFGMILNNILDLFTPDVAKWEWVAFTVIKSRSVFSY